LPCFGFELLDGGFAIAEMDVGVEGGVCRVGNTCEKETQRQRKKGDVLHLISL
jgi:hypothetical protein